MGLLGSVPSSKSKKFLLLHNILSRSVRHGHIDEYYLELTHFCLCIRLKLCLLLTQKNHFTSFYFLLQRKCFCHIILLSLIWRDKLSTKNWAFHILHPRHHIRCPPTPTPHCFPAIELTHQMIAEQETEQHCAGNKVFSDKWNTHNTVTASSCVEKRGFRHTNWYKVANYEWHHQHKPQCPFISVGNKCFLGFLKTLFHLAWFFSSVVSPGHHIQNVEPLSLPSRLRQTFTFLLATPTHNL